MCPLRASQLQDLLARMSGALMVARVGDAVSVIAGSGAGCPRRDANVPTIRQLFDVDADEVTAACEWVAARGSSVHLRLRTSRRNAHVHVFPIDVAHVGILVTRAADPAGTARGALPLALANAVSHELRTPLTAVRAALSLLESGTLGALGDQALQVVALARASAERLARATNELLDATAEEAAEVGSVDVGHLVESAIDAVSSEIVGARAEILHRTRATIRGEPRRLIAAVAHVLRHVVAHSEGSTVYVRCFRRHGAARIEVSGSHTATEEPWGEDAALIRDGGRDQKTGGTRLGLYLARRTVEMHAGRVGTEVLAGGRTTLWLELPARFPSPSAAQSMSYASSIFLVGFETAEAHELRQLLQTNGHLVLIAERLGDARRLRGLGQHPAGLVVDGLQVAFDEVAAVFGDNVPMVVLAGRETTDRLARLGESGVRMLRPVNQEVLLRLVHWMARRASRPRVLVVEPDPSAREMLVRELASDDLDVLEADSAQEALITAERAGVALVVTEAALPDEDPSRYLRALAAAAPNVPWVLWTAAPIPLPTALRGDGVRLQRIKSRVSEDELRMLILELVERDL